VALRPRLSPGVPVSVQRMGPTVGFGTAPVKMIDKDYSQRRDPRPRGLASQSLRSNWKPTSAPSRARN
jgi:hypothetical protein